MVLNFGARIAIGRSGATETRDSCKPEYCDKVQELDMWTNKYDPAMTCQPLAVPRERPPRRIMQTDKDVVFFYQGGGAGGGYGDIA